jgi:hypothetical protein
MTAATDGGCHTLPPAESLSHSPAVSETTVFPYSG